MKLRTAILLGTIVIPIPLMRVGCGKQAVAQEASSYSYEVKPAYRTATYERRQPGPAGRIIDDRPKPPLVCDGCRDLFKVGGGAVMGVMLVLIARDKAKS